MPPRFLSTPQSSPYVQQYLSQPVDAFGPKAQNIQFAAQLAEALAQAYGTSKGRSRRQGKQEALLQAIQASRKPSGWKNPDFNWVPPKGAVDMSIVGPDGHLVPESQRGAPDYRSRADLSRQLKPFRPDTAVLPDDTQVRGRDALINSLLNNPDLANLTSDDMTPLLSILLSEAMEKPKLPTTGEVLATVPTTKQIPAFGPLVDPEQAFSSTATTAIPLTDKEQYKSDWRALRAAGIGDMSMSTYIAQREVEDQFAQRQEKRTPDYRVGDVLRGVPNTITIDGITSSMTPVQQLIADTNALREANLPVDRAGSSVGFTWVELNKRRAEYRADERAKAAESRKQQLSKDLESFKADLTGEDQSKRLEGAQKLRKEFTQVAGDFIAAKAAYERLRSAGDSAFGDIALIIGYMKVLDPSSIVRESEFDQVAFAASVPDKLANVYSQILSGTRLQASQRAELKAEARALFEPLVKDHGRIEKQFTELATRYGYDRDEVIINYRGEIEEASNIEELPEVSSNEGKPPAAVGAEIPEESVNSHQVVMKNGLAYKKGKLFTGSVTVNGVMTHYENGNRVLPFEG